MDTNEHERAEWRSLILHPAPDAPADMPPGEASVDVPIHPYARSIELDTPALRVGSSRYVRTAAPMSYEIPLDLDPLQEWFEHIFAEPPYDVDSIVGRSRRAGVDIHWARLHVRPARTPDVILQLTLRRSSAGTTVVTYCVEQHPVPPRDPASLLPTTVQRVEVEYTFMNGPTPTVRRIITDPAAIRALIQELNALRRDIRGITFGRMMDRWANLRFITAGGDESQVYIDPAHDIIRVNGFPSLLGNIWSLLTELAPPGKGAGGLRDD
jgi:hypothetical protein